MFTYHSSFLLGNTGIITNSVIILFVCDLDELLYGILMVVSPRWVNSVTNEADDDYSCDGAEVIQSGDSAEFKSEIARLKGEVRMLSQNIKLMLKLSPELAGILDTPEMDKNQDEFTLGGGVNLD